MKKESQKVSGVSTVDVHYVNTGRNSEGISWSGIVLDTPSHKADNNPTSSENNLPMSAMLAMDCETDDNDNVELEMTVTSEFTLVGYDDNNDDLVPDEETLKNYISASGDGLKRERQWMSPLEQNGLKRDNKAGESSPCRRGRPRKVRAEFDGDWSGDFEPCSVSAKTRKILVKRDCPYECVECGRSFPTVGGLKIHSSTHIESGNHTCFVCGTSFDSLTDLQSHVSSHPSANICLECGRWFKDKKILKCHTARHTSESAGGGMIMDCGMCGLEFELMVDLADHVSVHTPELMWNACLVCGRHLAPLSSMEKHLRTHTGAKMATCPICARQFAEAYNLKSHMRIHTGERPFSCPQCRRQFTSVSTLKNHVLTHSKEKHYACKLCDKRFRRSSHLVEHRRSHTGERPYACPECGNRYTTSTALRSHLITHSHEKRYSCVVCDFATSRSLSLRKHMRTHLQRVEGDPNASAEEKSFMCSVCGKQFAKLWFFERHMQAHRWRREQGLEDIVSPTPVQTMEKQYGCPKCDRQFARYRNLQKHVFIHDSEGSAMIDGRPFRRIGDKPYVCAECGRQFARVGNMQKHFMTHRGQDVDDKSDIDIFVTY